jgi:hypothetical protein
MRISTSSGLATALFTLSIPRHDYFCAKFDAKLLKPDTAYAGKQGGIRHYRLVEHKWLKAALQRSLPFIYQYFRTNNFNLRNAS